jgi:hypothetical protein
MLLMYVCVFIFYEDAESEYTYAEREIKKYVTTRIGI